MGKKHPIYAGTVEGLAGLYWNMGNYAIAEPMYQESLKFKTEVLGEKHPSYASSIHNLAGLHEDMGHFSTAEPLYQKGLKIRKQVLGDKHPEYARSLYDLSRLNWLSGAQTEAIKQRKLVKNWSIAQAEIQFAHLTETQREAFYNEKLKGYLNGFNAFAIEMPQINTAELFDLQLSTKALLMKSSQKMKSRILNSNDTLLIKKFWEWNTLKGQIIKANEMSENVRKEKGIKLDSLMSLNENLEKFLSKKSEAFASLTDKKQTNWRDVQAKLKTNEVAIEMIRINKFGVTKVITDTSDVKKAPNFPKYKIYGFTDTIYYVALIVKKTSKKPELLILKNGNDLEDKYLKNYQNSIKYKLEDEYSYTQYWQQIADKLQGINKVYFSPDGIYNQINLNSLQNNKTGKFIIDETEIHTVTNTKDLLSFGKKVNLSKKAQLFGYPIYDLDKEYFTAEYIKNQGNVGIGDYLASRSLLDLKESVSLLPNTATEIDGITTFLTKGKFEAISFVEKNATEEQLKSVKNPKIMHIATHGFFINSNEKNEKVNPMLRSGLLLTGCTNYAKAEPKPETEDGILTALEAANLDLDETDLVVLSACETGLGDIKSGEGVYGLQRAFKVAGTKTIVMSLWKVDDAVTQKLMTAFYENYAQTNNARTSFKTAQSQIKAQYPQPYFWGAFVMVGE